MNTEYLDVEQVVYLHRRLMLEESQQSILAAPDKLEAAVLRPQATAFGEDAYPTLAEKAAALLESLVIAHPFMDGNKRIAFGAMAAFLKMNNVLVAPDQDAMYDLVIGVASGEIKGVEVIAEALRSLYAPMLT